MSDCSQSKACAKASFWEAGLYAAMRATNNKGMLERSPALDGLRAIAISLVVCFHATQFVPDSGFLGIFFQTGWNGVQLFFVLSGFLVGSLAFHEISACGSLNLKSFWGRRFMRTWPLYFILLTYFSLKAQNIYPSLFHYLTFTQNFFALEFFIPTWSLAVEEQFYLTLPLLLIGLIKWGRLRAFPWIALAGVLAPLFLRSHLETQTNTFAVIDSILVGTLLAYLELFHPNFLRPIKNRPHLFLTIGLLIVYLPFLSSAEVFKKTFLLTGSAVGFGIILTAVRDGNTFLDSVLKSRMLAKIALVSYSTYLTHEYTTVKCGQLISYLKLSGTDGLLVMLGLSLLSSFLLGWILFQVIERNALRIRDRFFPRPIPLQSKVGQKKSGAYRSA